MEFHYKFLLFVLPVTIDLLDKIVYYSGILKVRERSGYQTVNEKSDAELSVKDSIYSKHSYKIYS